MPFLPDDPLINGSDGIAGTGDEPPPFMLLSRASGDGADPVTGFPQIVLDDSTMISGDPNNADNIVELFPVLTRFRMRGQRSDVKIVRTFLRDRSLTLASGA